MAQATTPHKLSLKQRLLVSLGIKLYTFYVSTWRLKRINPWWENRHIDPDRPILFASWHEDDFTLIGPNRGRGYVSMVSLSKDGELMNLALTKLKYRTVRGSSSRGGARAMLGLIRAMKKDNSNGVLTIDGPRGPRHEAKAGIIAIAYKTNAQIVTIAGAASPRHILKKTWSQAYIPLPFAKVYHCFPEYPIQPPVDNSEEEFARVKSQVENQLKSDHERIQSILGYPPELSCEKTN